MFLPCDWLDSDFSARLWTNSPLVSRTQAQSLQTHGQSTPSAPVKKHTNRGDTKIQQCYSKAAHFGFSRLFFFTTGNFHPFTTGHLSPSRQKLVQADLLKLLSSCQMRLLGTWMDQILLGKKRESTLVGKERALVATRKTSLEFTFGSK